MPEAYGGLSAGFDVRTLCLARDTLAAVGGLADFAFAMQGLGSAPMALRVSSSMPTVPTIAESGYPGFEATNWYAFVAPGKTPREILDYWNREIVKALNDPQVKAELGKQGLDPAPGTREALAQYMERELQVWGKVVKDAKITAE